MIAYDELAAALERWRIRNGLPATPPLFADGRAAPAPRATQAIASAPPPPVAAPAAPAVRSPPPPPSGRSTVIGMAAPAPGQVAAAAATAAMALVPPPPDDDGADLGEADVLEEADPYDNQGSDFAVEFGDKTAAAAAAAPPATGDAGSSADGWPEAKTVSTYGWGQATPATPAAETPGDDEATHIGDATRHD